MNDPDRNRAYYQRRAAEEQSAADHAGDERARRSHLELSRRYSEAAATGTAQMPGEPPPPPPGLLTPEFRILN